MEHSRGFSWGGWHHGQGTRNRDSAGTVKKLCNCLFLQESYFLFFTENSIPCCLVFVQVAGVWLCMTKPCDSQQCPAESRGQITRGAGRIQMWIVWVFFSVSGMKWREEHKVEGIKKLKRSHKSALRAGINSLKTFTSLHIRIFTLVFLNSHLQEM